MLVEQHKYTSVENQFRQSLMRGYNRLRLAQGQWVRLDSAELILELLGDFQVLEFCCNHSKDASFTLPFAYLVSWKADIKEPLQRQLENQNKTLLSGKCETCCSTYRRIRVARADEEDKNSKLVHENLGHALKDYLYHDWRPRPPLLDVLTDPLSRYEHFVSENWQAIREVKQNELHRPFGDGDMLFPDEVREVNGVMRLTLPIGGKEDDPAPMVSLILGVAIKATEPVPDGKSEKLAPSLRSCGEICLDCGNTRICRNGMRRIAEILSTDVLEYYRRLRNVKHAVGEKKPEPVMLSPGWLRKPDRDPLHAAVDELHRDINRFIAQTSGSPQDYKGFNFLLAFRELNPHYADSLRYRLSLDNLQALDSAIEAHGTVPEWRKSALAVLSSAEEALRVLLQRHRAAEEAADTTAIVGSGADEAVEAKFKALKKEIQDAIERIGSVTDVNALKRTLVQEIESNSYPANLTPGYSIMNLGHPEIIQGWLKDPRAVGFENYPPGLLAWELSALPEQIYYSSLTDGMIPIGVCGVDARFRKYCSPYDVQEIINQKAQRFRYILCEEKLAQFQNAMVMGVTGYYKARKEDDRISLRALVFVGALRAFRELAYLYLPTQHDYHTKLVYEPKLSAIPVNWVPRMESRSTVWKTAEEVSSGAWVRIADLQHLPLPDFRGEYGVEENDFIKDFVTLKGGKFSAILHAITFKIIQTTLLFLVPEHHRYHQDVVNEFVRNVLSRTENAFTASLVKEATQSEEGDPRTFFSYNRKDEEAVKELLAALKARGFDKVFFDQSDIDVADKWFEAAIKGIDNCPKALVIYGEHGEGQTQGEEIDCIIERRRKNPDYRSAVVLLPGAQGKFEELRFPLRTWNNINLRSNYEEGLENLLKFLKKTLP